MKKFLVVMLTLALLAFALTGCSSKTEEPATTPETPAETTETAEPAETVDAVATASVVQEGDALVKAMSADGFWLAATLNDIVLDEEIVIDGQFEHNDAPDRKLALYTQDENRKITAQFTLTAPKMTVKSENFRITGGTFVGDIYVEANGFKLDKSSTVEGNIYFATKEALDTFTVLDSSVHKGMIQVDGVDVVTSASLVTDANALVQGLSADGTWLVATYNNMVLSQDIIVEGEFTNRDVVARKLGLYTQDADRNITASFTVAAPKMIVRSENFKIQGGTFIGDIYVEANGFQIGASALVQGNIFFAKQEYMDSFIMDDTGMLEGEKSVQ